MRLALLPWGLLACSPDDASVRDVLPDDRLLVDEGVFEPTSLSRTVGQSSPYAALTLAVITETNAGLRGILDVVFAITSAPPTTRRPGFTQWGPWEDGGVTAELVVTEDPLTWGLGLKRTGDPAFVEVLQGEIDPFPTPLASEGRMWLDLGALDALGLADGARGTLAADYQLREHGSTTWVFAGDLASGDALPVDAATRFDHDRGEGGTMDVVWRTDVSAPPNGTEEVATVRARWTPTGAGRADAYLTEGDLGLLTFTESECWSRAQTVVYRDNNYTLTTEGDADACAFDTPSFAP